MCNKNANWTVTPSIKAFCILLIATTFCSGAMAETNENIADIFKQHKVVPDVLTTAPKSSLKVSYGEGVLAANGIELTPTQVKAAPIVDWDAEDGAFYTLIMTDPDAPSRKNPKFREYHHWLVVNIPGKAVDQGEVLTAYVGSGPPEGTGLHRYVFLVYKQSGKLKFNETPIPKNSGQNRPNFKTANFAKKHKLGDPIAGNFYQAQWDEYVPTVHKQLSGKK